MDVRSLARRLYREGVSTAARPIVPRTREKDLARRCDEAYFLYLFTLRSVFRRLVWANLVGVN